MIVLKTGMKRMPSRCSECELYCKRCEWDGTGVLCADGSNFEHDRRPSYCRLMATRKRKSAPALERTCEFEMRFEGTSLLGCSECNYVVYPKNYDCFDFCPGCGARIIREEVESNGGKAI